ncbi:MAG: DUF2442 domain-containing protein [Bacteroidota bacterium]|nr:DUF2442 domain-containing protein [Bacteroidota bacterium]
MENVRIIEAEYISDFKINLEFSDGYQNVVDFKNELWGEVFEPLNDVSYFRNFKTNPFTIYWDNGADFSPEYLYELAKKNEFSVADKKFK